MNIIPKDSKYIPFTQQKKCCVPTCFLMIMYRNKIPLMAPEELGYHMGLIVHESNVGLFWNPRTGEKPKGGYGTQLKTEEFEINKVLKKLDIPLKVTMKLINTFETEEDFNKYLRGLESTSKDIIIGFDAGLLNGNDFSSGHLNLLDKVDVANLEIRLVEPSYNSAKWKIVKNKDLFENMKSHGVNNLAGFWEVEKI